MLRVRTRLLAGAVTIVPFLAGAQCVAPPTPPSSSTATVDAALQRLGKDKALWTTEIKAIESAVSTNAELLRRVRALEADALTIVKGEPGCTAWVASYIYEALVDVRAQMDGTRHPLPTPVCPVVPSRVVSARYDEFILFGFATDEAPPITARMLASGGEIASFQADVTATGKFVFSSPEFIAATCRDGRLAFLYAEQEFLSVPTTTRREPDPQCMASANTLYTEEISGCTHECCAFADQAACVASRCVGECEARKRANPSLHPAVEDACSPAGAFYQWCRSDCESVDVCKQDWCGEPAPRLRQACEAEAHAHYEARLRECPLLEACQQ